MCTRAPNATPPTPVLIAATINGENEGRAASTKEATNDVRIYSAAISYCNLVEWNRVEMGNQARNIQRERQSFV